MQIILIAETDTRDADASITAAVWFVSEAIFLTGNVASFNR